MGRQKLRRGDIYWADLPSPTGRRPVLLVLRNEAISTMPRVIVAPISSVIRGLRSELRLGLKEGLRFESVAQCDGLQSVDERSLADHPLGRLGFRKVLELDRALRFALEIRY